MIDIRGCCNSHTNLKLCKYKNDFMKLKRIIANIIYLQCPLLGHELKGKMTSQWNIMCSAHVADLCFLFQ